jgi:hypothetical protein
MPIASCCGLNSSANEGKYSPKRARVIEMFLVPFRASFGEIPKNGK